MSWLPRPGDLWIDRYEITAELGRGGFGRVYRAWDRMLERDVAIKMLRHADAFTPTDLRRFRRETNIAAGLDHPGIVTVYDGGEHDGLLYLVMRFVPGRDLRFELEQAPLAQRRAVSIIRQVGAALDYAHAKGLVHRDVKPGNVLCEADADVVYLADFGISRRVDQTTDNPVTQGLAPATLAYAAPEQMRTDVRVDGRADLYALGCVLFECLTGRKPFTGEMAALITAHLHDDPPQVSAVRTDLSAAWDGVIATAMAKDAAQRFQRCAELTAAAEAAAGESVASQGALATAGRPARRSDRPAGSPDHPPPDPRGAQRSHRPAGSPERPAAAAPGPPAREVTRELDPGDIATERAPAPASDAASGPASRAGAGSASTAQATALPTAASPTAPTAPAAPAAPAMAAAAPDAVRRPISDPIRGTAARPATAAAAPPRSPTGEDADQAPGHAEPVAPPAQGVWSRLAGRGGRGDRPTRWRWLLAAMAAIGALALVAALVVPGDDARPPRTTAGGGDAPDGADTLDDGQRELLATVGLYDAASCRRPSADPLDAAVAVACEDPDQAPTRVVFRRFASAGARDAAFADLARTAGDGDCSTGRRAAHAYTGAGGTGRVVCAVDAEKAGISWTVPGAPIMGSARLDDPSAAAELYLWWSDAVRRSDS